MRRRWLMCTWLLMACSTPEERLERDAARAWTTLLETFWLVENDAYNGVETFGYGCEGGGRLDGTSTLLIDEKTDEVELQLAVEFDVCRDCRYALVGDLDYTASGSVGATSEYGYRNSVLDAVLVGALTVADQPCPVDLAGEPSVTFWDEAIVSQANWQGTFCGFDLARIEQVAALCEGGLPF